MDHAGLQCSVVIQNLNVDCQTVKKQVILRQARVSTVRDDSGSIMIRVTPLRTAGARNTSNSLRSSGFSVIELTIFKNFIHEGKATIKLPHQFVQIALSNCPPDQLRLFLGTLRTKWRIAVSRGLPSERRKLREGQGPVTATSLLEEISPLRNRDRLALDEVNVRQFFANAPQKIVDAGKENVSRKRKQKDLADLSPVGNVCGTPPQKATKPPRQLTSTPVRGQFKARTSSNQSDNVKRAAVVQPKSAALLTPRNQGLTEEQLRVLEAVRAGKNVFYTGSAGTGKSFLINKIIGMLPPDQTVVTASTGVAACQIGGRTLHSFAGIGSGTSPLERCIELAFRPVAAAAWRRCRHLIVDEVSLVDTEFFDKLDQVGRVVRGCMDRPFGGIQLILCGDFFQLPPVTRFDKSAKKASIPFAFKSCAWKRSVDTVVELTQVQRQSDPVFIDLLQSVRMGECPSRVSRMLAKTADNRLSKDGILATQLCTHRVDVEQRNRTKLAALTGESKVFLAQDSDPMLSSKMDSHCPAPHRLELKIGAQVMLVKNLDVGKGLVNGSRGVVIRLLPASEGSYPVVRFISGPEVPVFHTRWSVALGNGPLVCTRQQLPLRLAWAISVHKSQGMTLDFAELHLAKTFECGQAYVALSRCRSLESLRVVDWHPSCVRTDPDVIAFYRNMRANSYS